MPSSSARATARSWSAGSPRVISPPTAPQPNERTETSSPVLPSRLRSILPRLAVAMPSCGQPPLKHAREAAGKGGERSGRGQRDGAPGGAPPASHLVLDLLDLAQLPPGDPVAAARRAAEHQEP